MYLCAIKGLTVYVDDLVIAGTTQEAISVQITDHSEDLGELDRILNMEVSCTVVGGLFLSQSLYVKYEVGEDYTLSILDSGLCHSLFL